MKKYLSLMIISLSLLLLSACSQTSSQAQSQSSTDLPAAESPEISKEMQLAVGTLQLEKTDQAVTPDQAAELLPLWKAAQSLAQSENTTSLEMNGLFDQIREKMTPAQLEVIDGMEMDFNSFRTLAQELGIDAGPAGLQSDPSMQATAQAMRASGQFPGRGGFEGQGFAGGGPPEAGFSGGGFPGGGPGAGLENGSSGSANSNQRAGAAGRIFYPVVIQLLEGKLQ